MSAWYGIVSQTDPETRKRLKEIVNPREIVSAGLSEGCSHHEIELIVEDVEGRFWYLASSGCSCGARGTIRGPVATEREAWAFVTDRLRDEMKRFGYRSARQQRRHLFRERAANPQPKRSPGTGWVKWGWEWFQTRNKDKDRPARSN